MGLRGVGEGGGGDELRRRNVVTGGRLRANRSDLLLEDTAPERDLTRLDLLGLVRAGELGFHKHLEELGEGKGRAGLGEADSG